MSRLVPVAVLFVLAAVLAGCATPAAPTRLEDGEIALPAGYRSWPVFLAGVQRPDIKQVREIYVNDVGFRVQAGYAYDYGATFVMENWAAKVGADGQPQRGADGKLVKDRLLKVFVMQKGTGFAKAVPEELKTGLWAFGSYDAQGAKIAEPFAACRGCHLPMARHDFVMRADEFLAARSGLQSAQAPISAR